MRFLKKSLLEFCADRLQCYISDLSNTILENNIVRREVLARVLYHIESTEYEMEEWKEAAQYISGAIMDFNSVIEVKKYLYHYLKTAAQQ